MPIIVKSQREVAELFGEKMSTLVYWRRQGMPGDKGQYDLVEIFQWWKARQETPKTSDLDESERRLKAAKAELAELKLSQERRILVPRDEMETLEIKLCTAFRGALMGLASTLSQDVALQDARDAYHTIRRRFCELLESFEPTHARKREERHRKRKRAAKKRTRASRAK